jgi:hypothetical protein
MSIIDLTINSSRISLGLPYVLIDQNVVGPVQSFFSDVAFQKVNPTELSEIQSVSRQYRES